MGQLGVLGEREREPGELLGAEVIGACELEVAGAEDYRRERWGLARVSNPLDPPADLDQPLGERPDHMEAVHDVGRVPEVTLDRGPVGLRSVGDNDLDPAAPAVALRGENQTERGNPGVSRPPGTSPVSALETTVT
jgi:hypothetical protein